MPRGRRSAIRALAGLFNSLQGATSCLPAYSRRGQLLASPGWQTVGLPWLFLWGSGGRFALQGFLVFSLLGQPQHAQSVCSRRFVLLCQLWFCQGLFGLLLGRRETFLGRQFYCYRHGIGPLPRLRRWGMNLMPFWRTAPLLQWTTARGNGRLALVCGVYAAGDWGSRCAKNQNCLK